MQPLEVTLFNPAYNNDKFEMTSWTVDGKVGPVKAVYTGGYLVRHVEAKRRLHQLLPAACTPTTTNVTASTI